jgi:putative Mn2+ efflux pump MntP
MTGMIGRLCAEKVTQWVKENGGWVSGVSLICIGHSDSSLFLLQIRVLTNVDRKKWVRYIGGAALGILGVAILVSLWKK